MTTDDREAALQMARLGLATLSEIAELAATSRQLVRYWCLFEGIDIGEARKNYLQREWAKRYSA